MDNFVFSLIIGTLNRPQILEKCLNSLCLQRFKNFEIIIIDQSSDDKTKKIAENFGGKLTIRYCYSSVRGLSHARNIGLQKRKGEYICLIDDDAEYSDDYLLNANRLVVGTQDLALSGHIIDTRSNQSMVDYSKIRGNGSLSYRDIVKYFPSAGLIIPSSIIEKAGGFDEAFGVGSTYGAGEDTDFLLRCVSVGMKIIYCKELRIRHPIILENQYSSISPNKYREYGRGIGAMYKKHIVYLKNYSLIPLFLEDIAKKAGRAVIRFSERKEMLESIKGKVEGFKEYRSI